MTQYNEREIKELKETIKLYENVKVEADLTHERDYNAVPKELKPDELNRKIMYYKAVLSVYEYFVEKLGDREHLMLGKYIGLSMGVWGNDFRFNLYLEHGETESRLYDYVFGSHSGINEFFQDHFPDLFSVILGSTGYSHALGSYDLSDALGFFKRFGYTDYKRDFLCWAQKDFDDHISKAKKILDWFFKLSEDTELMNDVDNVLTTYLEVVFKYNKGE